MSNTNGGMAGGSAGGARGKRRTFTAAFKAEAALSLLTGQKTQAELCREHELSPTLVGQWKSTLVSNAAVAFKSGEGDELSGDRLRIAELEQALGRATLENDILKKASRLLNPSGGKRS